MFTEMNAILRPLLVAFILGIPVSAASLKAQTMRDVVKLMPDTLTPLLTHNNLLDFPDYLDSQMKAEVTNRLGGTSEMKRLTDDFAEINLTSATSLQLKLLLKGKGKVVCLIRTFTINDSIGDSQVQFYTTDWKLLPIKKHLSSFSVHDQAAFMCASLSAETTDLTLRWSYPLSIEFDGQSEKKVKAGQPTVLKWNGKQYK
jgi:hypothetical protein